MARRCQTIPNNPCESYPDTKCIVYSGADLTCINVKTNDRLDVILENINQVICNGGGGGGDDEKVKVSFNDTVPSYLIDKLVEGSGIILTENNNGGNETLSVSVDTAYISGLYWSLTGNSGTTPGTNFLGTTDDQALVFKVNNQFAGYISSVPSVFPSAPQGSVVAIGHYAAESYIPLLEAGDLNGSNSVFVGFGAGRSIGATYDSAILTASNANTYVGQWSGYYTQHRNEIYGQGRNCGFGQSSLFSNISGCYNNAFGVFSLESNVKGNANNGYGDGTLRSNVDGDFNSAFGASSALYNSTGIRSITVTNGGSGYTTATVTISAPRITGNPGTCIVTATASATIVAGVITAITIIDPGCGYSARGGTFSTGISQPAVTVTITGDGSNATATANLVSGSNNTSVGTLSAAFNRFTSYTSSFGNGANQSSRYFDFGGTFLGAFSSIDSSVPSLTPISKAVAIGYNSKVGASNTLALGGIGADALDVVIGGIIARATLDVVGDVAIETITNDDTEDKIVVWNSTDKILEYRLASTIPGAFALTNGSGTTVGGDTTSVDLGGTLTADANIILAGFDFNIKTGAYINFSVDASAVYASIEDGVDPTIWTEFVQTKNYFILSTQDSGHHGDAQIESTGTEATVFISATDNTTYFSRVNVDDTGAYIKSTNTGNVSNLVGLTVGLTGEISLDTVNNDNAEDKLLTWNSVSKNIEYRTVASLSIPTDTNFANTDLTLTGNRVHDGNAFGLIFSNFDNIQASATDISFDITTASLYLVSGGNAVLTGNASVDVVTSGIFTISDASLATAANGYVWTLIDDITGEGGWVAAGAGAGTVTDFIFTDANGFDGTVTTSTTTPTLSLTTTVTDNQIMVSNSGAISGDANLTWDATTLNVNGAAIFNDAGAAVDFRIESDTKDHLFFIDGTKNEIYIGFNGVPTDSGAYILQVEGSTYHNGNIVFPTTNGVSFSSGTASINYSTLFGSPALLNMVSAGNRWVVIDNGPSGAILDLQMGSYPSYDNSTFYVNARLNPKQGADVASAAGAIALGRGGNTFEITGTASITLISNLNWVNGAHITLLFTSTATLVDGTANSGTDIGIETGDGSNFTAAAGDVITLVLSEIGGTQRWREVSRSTVGGTSLTANNGINIDTNVIQLGGDLVEDTVIGTPETEDNDLTINADILTLTGINTASLTATNSVFLSGSDIKMTTVTNDNTKTRILAIDGSTNQVYYKTVASFNAPRVDSTTSSATPTINTDNVDIYKLTAQAAAITSFTTNLSGTPVDGQVLEIQITDNGTARAITWGASFVASSVPLPTTTVLGVTLTVIFQYYVTSSYGANKWTCVNYF